MNYLGHYYYNHVVCGRPEEPYFALGAALPDLWARFSRVRRIRWKAVRAARPREPLEAQLRAGLLSHVEADRRFHLLPCFLNWLRELKADPRPAGLHSMLVDFLAHLAIELALDHHLAGRERDLPVRFYERLAYCDARLVEHRLCGLAAVDARGLAPVITAFRRRRFLCHFTEPAALAATVQRVLQIAALGPVPPDGWLDGLLARAAALVEPDAVWAALSDSAAVRTRDQNPQRRRSLFSSAGTHLGL